MAAQRHDVEALVGQAVREQVPMRWRGDEDDGVPLRHPLGREVAHRLAEEALVLVELDHVAVGTRMGEQGLPGGGDGDRHGGPPMLPGCRTQRSVSVLRISPKRSPPIIPYQPQPRRLACLHTRLTARGTTHEESEKHLTDFW